MRVYIYIYTHVPIFCANYKSFRSHACCKSLVKQFNLCGSLPPSLSPSCLLNQYTTPLHTLFICVSYFFSKRPNAIRRVQGPWLCKHHIGKQWTARVYQMSHDRSSYGSKSRQGLAQLEIAKVGKQSSELPMTFIGCLGKWWLGEVVTWRSGDFVMC